MGVLLLWLIFVLLALWPLGEPLVQLYAAWMRLWYRRGGTEAAVILVSGRGGLFATYRTHISLGYHRTDAGAERAARRGAVVADVLTHTLQRDWGIYWGIADGTPEVP